MSTDAIRTFSLGSRAQLMVDTMPGAAGVAIGLWFPIGSAFERDGERGLSHFVEHMVFKGAGDRSAEELSRAIDRVGGYLNAFTEREAVCFHCTLPAEHAGLAASVLLDMAYRPRFSRDEFEREKDVIVNEILAAEDDLEDAGQDEFFAMAYAGHPMARRIAGREEDVRAATFEGLSAFHDERLARGRLVISVAGAVDADAVAAQFAAAVPDGPAAGGFVPPLPSFRHARRMVPATGSQIYAFTGLPLDGMRDEDDYWRLAVANSAYGESMSSRLFMRLRERLGLCYSVSSAYSLTSLAGVWGVAASTTPAQFPRFADEYAREAGLLFRDGLEATELAEANSRIRGLLALASDDPEYRMKRLARQYFLEGTAEPLSRTVARLSPGGSVDPDSVNALVRRALDPAKESVLLYGKLTKQAARAGASVFGAVMADPLDACGDCAGDNGDAVDSASKASDSTGRARGDGASAKPRKG